MPMTIKAFPEPTSDTFSYVLSDGRHAAIIDSVLGFDPVNGRTNTHAADKILAYVRDQALTVQWILETHAHADHLSAAAYLKDVTGGRTAIGEHIRKVQAVFKKLYHLDDSFRADGSPFDHLIQDGDVLQVGTLSVNALLVPGHTPADLAFQVGDAVFVGDTLFMPDIGTARTDFPGGSARSLYRSIRRILTLPGSTRLLHCHDYPPKGRESQWESTVASQRANNIHVRDGVTEDQFVAMREARDAILDAPRLILPALQVNIRAGQLPSPESNGVSYLKTPVNAF